VFNEVRRRLTTRMASDSRTPRDTATDAFVVAVMALVTIFALYLFRSADDNRLFSWKWVYADIGPAGIVVRFVPGIIVAYLLARLSVFERSPLAAPVLLSAAAAVMLWSEPELLMDASRYFTQAKHLEVYGAGYFVKEWGRAIIAWTDLPAVPFLFGLVFSLFGEHRTAIQTFTTLLFSSTVLLTFLIGKKLWSEEIGSSAGLLLLAMPCLVAQVPLMLVDIPTMFFLTLAIYTCMDALDRGGGRRVAVASCALFLAVFSKYSAWLFLSVLAIVSALAVKKDRPSAIRRSLAVLALSGALIAAATVLNAKVIADQLTLLTSYQLPGLERWGESHLSTFFFQVHPFVTIAAVCSFFVAFRKKDPSFLIISWLVVLVFLVDIRRFRYLLPMLPLLALMAAYGLQLIGRREVRSFIVSVAVVTSLITLFFGYLPFARNTSAMNIERAGAYLNSAGLSGVEVVTLPLRDPVVNPAVAVPLLDLFTRGKITYHYDPGPAPASSAWATSPVRFTREYQNPKYYTGDPVPRGEAAVVVISGEPIHDLPPSLRQRIGASPVVKRFGISSDPFRYKTIVDVYILQ
jgi:4-amino-4-deoxy-L-arabinose transferase-like glycosyltransferase